MLRKEVEKHDAGFNNKQKEVLTGVNEALKIKMKETQELKVRLYLLLRVFMRQFTKIKILVFSLCALKME